LVMATGTGKTYTAFQIIWRLWKSGARKRILFLVDRNILADQTKTNDFKPFGTAMTKITNRTVDKSFEIYLCLYQAVTGTEEEQNIYKQFSPGFFDLVIIDECHRGSAADDAVWKAGRKPHADRNGHARIHPRGFRRSARDTNTPVLSASRWNPHGKAVRIPPYIWQDYALGELLCER
jgi:predicted helicase